MVKTHKKIHALDVLRSSSALLFIILCNMPCNAQTPVENAASAQQAPRHRAPLRQSRFVFTASKMPSAGQTQAAALLAAAREEGYRRGTHWTPHDSPPQTLEQLIIAANAAESPYELTVGPLDQVKLGSTSFPDETAFDFNANSMYPGAIVQGKANYIDSGQLVTNPLQPGAGSLNLEGAILRPG